MPDRHPHAPHDAVDACANALLDSYQHDGGIRMNAISVSAIHEVLEYTRWVLYPGYYRPYPTATAPVQVRYDQDPAGTLPAPPDPIVALQHTLRRIQGIFTPAVACALAWGCQQDDEIHHASIQAQAVVSEWLGYLPRLRKELKQDIAATYSGDPAAQSHDDIILSYPGFQATLVYRLAHFLYQKKVPLIPRMMTEWAHSVTGIDIHPGATIGHSFCIDHGTGVVIGETAVIGHHVKLYHGVTLGALSVKKSSHATDPAKGPVPLKKRHPTLGNHVVVYAHATILGGHTDIGDYCTIGGNVWLTHSLPPRSTCYLSEDYRQLLTSKTQSQKDPS